MTTRKSSCRTTLSALVMALILAGCGGDSPESMVTSAKGYLAKNDTKAAVIQLKNALQAKPDLAEARFLLGKTMLEGGNPSGAEIELRKAAELNYSADELTPVMARTLLALGQSKKLIEELAKVQLSSPQAKADFQAALGLAYLSNGQVDLAATAFDTAVAAVPGHGQGLIGQARIKAGKQDLPGALALLDAAIEKDPKLHEAWLFKGEIFAVQRDAKAAEAAYRKALELKPDYLPAHSALVSHLLNEGRFDETAKALEAMKKISPSHPQTTYLQAQLQYRKKDFKSALESIQEHLKVAPESVMGLQLAGAINYEMRSYSTAETQLLKVLPKTPELGMARRLLIATYLRTGQSAKALSTLQPVIGKIDKDSNMLALAGEVLMQNGDAEKASEYFTKAAALDPENKSKQTSVAVSHLAQGDTTTAYRELEQIAAGDSGIKADMALISSQLGKREFDKALNAIDALEKKQPENPMVNQLRGSALLGKGDAVGARKSFEKALERNPAYFPAAASLANLDLVDKKPDEAKKRFESVVAKDPKNSQALLALAELLGKTGGKPEDVAAQINKAVSANPTEPAPRLALISLYLGSKDVKKAMTAAQDALAVLPDNPDLLDAVGRTQLAAEDYNQSLATYTKLASLVSLSPMPYLRMAEVQVAAKNKEEAMQNLRKALLIKENSLEAQRGIIMLDLDAGRTAEALAMAKKVETQRPKEAVGYVLEGDIHALKKAWSDAAAAYRNGISQTGAAELAVKLHAVLVAGGNAAEADKFADGWMKDHAKDVSFRLYMAESATARKDHQAAIKLYRQLLELQPENPALLNNLAWNMAQNKDPKAIDVAEKANKLAPGQPALMDTLGMLLVEKGDLARGVELLQKAIGLAPQNAAIRFNLAKSLIKAGKKDEAKKELEELAKLNDKFPDQAEVARLLKSLAG